MCDIEPICRLGWMLDERHVGTPVRLRQASGRLRLASQWLWHALRMMQLVRSDSITFAPLQRGKHVYRCGLRTDGEEVDADRRGGQRPDKV
jgi:hypothetical protein